MNNYQIIQAYSKNPQMIIVINGERVNLMGKEIKGKTVETKNSPSEPFTIRGATDDDYNYLLNTEETGKWDHIIQKIKSVKSNKG